MQNNMYIKCNKNFIFSIYDKEVDSRQNLFLFIYGIFQNRYDYNLIT